MKRLPIAGLAALTLLAAAAPASAAVSGKGSDPAGDAPSAAADIRAVEGSYDAEAGAVRVRITLGGAPAGGGDGFIGAVLGPPAIGSTQSGCGEPFVLIGALTDPGRPEALWRRTDRSYDDEATKSQSGTTIALSDTSVLLSDESWTCLSVVSQAGGATVDRLDAPIRLKAPPPPLTRAQKLRRALRRCRNFEGKRRRRCERTARTRYGKPKRKPRRKSRPAPAPQKGGLAGRIYSYPSPDPAFLCGGTCWEALAFTGRRYVYDGIADSAAIPRCTRTTYTKKRGAGCRPYRLSRDRRTVTVGDKRWRLTRNKKKLVRVGEGTDLFLSPVPRPGARYRAALRSISTYGSYPNSTVSTTFLTLDRRGRFALSGTILGSIGSPGAIETHFAGSSPAERGRYEFLSRGRLVLRYQNGKVRRLAAFLIPGGRETVGNGFYAGGRNYFAEDD